MNKSHKASRPEEREPTFTSLVEECLRRADDLCDVWFLAGRTGLNHNRISAALHMLHGYEVVDFIVEHSTKYWFLTGRDKRTRVIEAKKKEEPGTRRSRRITGRRVDEGERAPA